jgi:hypothetical protein
MWAIPFVLFLFYFAWRLCNVSADAGRRADEMWWREQKKWLH